MQPRIETLKAKRLIGKRIRMSFSNNRTLELWRSFMPRRNEIKNCTGPDLYSIEIYEPDFFNNFNPEKEFEKWVNGAAYNPPGSSTNPYDGYIFLPYDDPRIDFTNMDLIEPNYYVEGVRYGY